MPADFAEAVQYVVRMRQVGKTDDQIVAGLTRAGWTAQQLDLLAARLAVPLTCQEAGGDGNQPPAGPPRRIAVSELRMLPSGFVGDPPALSPGREWGVLDMEEEPLPDSSVDIKHRVALFRRGRPLWTAALGAYQPWECALNDAGFVAVSGSRDATPFKSRLWVWAPSGQLLLDQRLTAAPMRVSFSDCGGLAWCLTGLNPDDHTDACKLIVFSLAPPRLLFRAEDPLGEISSLWLQEDQVVLVAGGGLTYRYSSDGTLLNAAEVEGGYEEASVAVALEQENGYRLLDIVRARLAAAPVETLTRTQQEAITRLLQAALKCGVSDYQGSQARRTLGEIALLWGRKAEAIRQFKRALKLNPKIGLKRQLAKLEQEAGER